MAGTCVALARPAESFAAQRFDLIVARYGAGHIATLPAIMQLIELSQEWEQPARVEEWYGRARAIPPAVAMSFDAERTRQTPYKDGRPMIRAWIRFVDEDGRATWGDGHLQIRLRSEDGDVERSWDLDLRDLVDAKRFWSIEASEYVFPLGHGDEGVPERFELEAHFVRADGKRLEPAMLELD